MLEKYQEYTKKFEALRLKVYKCPAGKLTIGYGRNLEDIGISKTEADYLFKADFNRSIQDAMALCNKYGINYKDLSEARFFVLTDMAFNLGYERLLKFKKFFSALKKGLYDEAAKEMKDSLWYKQTGDRAKTLIKIMKTSSLV